MSEVTDCIAIIVSEETGKISVAMSGNITRDYTATSLKKKIDDIIESDKPSDNLKKMKKEKIFSWMVKKK